MKMLKSLFITSFVFMTACSYNEPLKPLVAKQVTVKKNNNNKVKTQAVKKQKPVQLVEKKEIKTAAVNKSPVIAKLIADANKSTKQGEFNVAAATLERALRISPREAKIFNKLAYVRFKQKRWELAENLAKKSALLAEGDRALKKKNWLLIYSIRKQKGDYKGADYALLKAKKI